MEFNVSQQMKAPIGTEREYDLDDFVDILGFGVGNKVNGQVKLTRTNQGLLVKGTINSKVPVECSRCLKVFDQPLTIELEEEYFPTIDVNNGSTVDIPDDPSNLFIDEHHILDLREAIRQNALLVIPMKPLCKPDCAGICSQCGKDLNTRQCKCNTKEIDPRWSKLVDLKTAVKESKKYKKETK
jgi:uncharacterized protein